jgi:hypothetical protein
MEQSPTCSYVALVDGTDSIEGLIAECRIRGSEIPVEAFEQGCRLVAGFLGEPLADPGLDEHFVYLLEHGDRLAAVHLLLPHDCAYQLKRDVGGQVSASVTLAGRDSSTLDMNYDDDEGIALLAALAKALQQPARLSYVRH